MLGGVCYSRITWIVLFRRPGFNGKRMDAAGKLIGQELVDLAVTVDPAHAGKHRRNDPDTEMGFATFAPAAMTAMFLGFVDNIEKFRSKRGCQFGNDYVFRAHGTVFASQVSRVNSGLGLLQKE